MERKNQQRYIEGIEGLDKLLYRSEEDMQEGGGVLFCTVCDK